MAKNMTTNLKNAANQNPEQIATSFHQELNDLDYTPFDGKGGRGKMHQLFGGRMSEIINELNEVLVA
jgi:type I restriction enzyme R subunit